MEEQRELALSDRAAGVVKMEVLRDDIATMLEFAYENGTLDVDERKILANKILTQCHRMGLRLII